MMLQLRMKLFGLLALAFAGAARAADEGEALFYENCSVCHQLHGEGLPPHFYPALGGNAFLLGEDDQLILLLMKGRDGMPNLGRSLSDQQLSKILTYARGAWGNAAPPITPEQVAQLRKSLPAEGPLMFAN